MLFVLAAGCDGFHTGSARTSQTDSADLAMRVRELEAEVKSLRAEKRLLETRIHELGLRESELTARHSNQRLIIEQQETVIATLKEAVEERDRLKGRVLTLMARLDLLTQRVRELEQANGKPPAAPARPTTAPAAD